MPDASISGDAIVGFPGETEEQFEATARLVREVGFDRVNTAAFSPRPGTAAAEREDQVADLVKADRLNRLNAVVDEVAEERYAAAVESGARIAPPDLAAEAHRFRLAVERLDQAAPDVPWSTMVPSNSRSICMVFSSVWTTLMFAPSGLKAGTSDGTYSAPARA